MGVHRERKERGRRERGREGRQEWGRAENKSNSSELDDMFGGVKSRELGFSVASPCLEINLERLHWRVCTPEHVSQQKEQPASQPERASDRGVGGQTDRGRVEPLADSRPVYACLKCIRSPRSLPT